jgi:hypothetical protein
MRAGRSGWAAFVGGVGVVGGFGDGGLGWMRVGDLNREDGGGLRPWRIAAERAENADSYMRDLLVYPCDSRSSMTKNTGLDHGPTAGARKTRTGETCVGLNFCG